MGNVINYLKSGGGGDDELAKNLIERSEFTEENPLVIPNGTTKIGNSAFSRYENLYNIIIPNSVTAIGEEAFYVCSNLKSITIPDSVRIIKNSAFSNCKKLLNINLENVTTIGSSAFAYCYDLANNETGLILNNNLTIINNSTFIECGNMKLFSLPNNITEIGNYAFKSC